MSTKPFNVEDYIPGDLLMQIAWRDCLMWASSHGPTLEAFTADTGMKLGSTAMDRAIDAATGYDVEVVRRFVDWFNENVWGEECAPKEQV